jgi:phage terminase large subunit-like protein
MPRKRQEDLLARYVSKDGSLDPAKAIDTVKTMMRLMFFKPNRIQIPFFTLKNKYGRTPKRRIMECGEKTGKTRAGIAEDIAHLMGYRPWLLADDPDYKIAIPVPNHGLLGCETMGQSVEAKIEPELRLLIPEICAPEWKNDSTGALKHVTLRYDTNGRQCGSTLHLRSYNQHADTFRGIDPHFVHWDEPPPQDILKAVERGKVVTNSPSWFTMTPLKEAYIFDLFSVRAFNDNGSDQEIAIFKGSMWDNCQDYCRDCDCYIPENDPVNLKDPHEERPVDWCPLCGKIMGFVPKAGIKEYAKLYTDKDELDAHLEGKWAHLSGLVYKTLDAKIHKCKDFEIPRDWMRVEAVDPHDARPTRWNFFAVSPEEIVINGKPANRAYCYTYLLANGNVNEIVKSVRMKRAEHGYIDPQFVILDAKFGSKSIKTGDEETSWEEELEKAGIGKIRLSHSAPGDVALGHKRVKEYLALHYSKLRDASLPGILFFEEGTKGDRGPWQDMSNYQWKPGTDKPEEAYKDMCDTVRYFALEQPVYVSPDHDRIAALLMAARKQETTNYLTYGMRLAGG